MDIFEEDMVKIVKLAKSLGQCLEDFRIKEEDDRSDAGNDLSAYPIELKTFIEACQDEHSVKS